MKLAIGIFIGAIVSRFAFLALELWRERRRERIYKANLESLSKPR